MITESVGSSLFSKILTCVETLRQEAVKANDAVSSHYYFFYYVKHRTW